MNKRLRAYLEQIGLEQGADNTRAVAFFQGLRGLRMQIANALNFNEGDTEADQAANTAIRAFGFNPENPTQALVVDSTPTATGERTATEPTGEPTSATGVVAPVASTQNRGQTSTTPVTRPPAAGSDGASLEDHRRGMNEGAAQERARQQAIREMASLTGATDDQLRAALEGEQTVEQVRAAWYSQRQSQQTGVSSQPGAPAIHSRNSQTDFSRQSLTAALMLRFGQMDDPTQHFRNFNRNTGMFSRALNANDEGVIRAVDRGYELRELPLVEIARRCLELDNIRCEPTPSSVMEGMARAATMSGSTLVAVYTQAAGAIMLDAYDRAEDESLAFVRVGSASNFFQREAARMGKMGALTKHARGGQADNVQTRDSKSFFKINRYSGKFTIDEMDLIDDTFGQLSQHTLSEMGETAKSITPDLVFAILLSNPSLNGTPLFDATHGNIAAGGLTRDGIKAAIGKFALQQEDGVTLNLRGKHVIVPSTKEVDAWEELRSVRRVGAGGGTNESLPDLNGVSQLGLNIIPSHRVDTGVYDHNTNSAISGDDTKTFMATDRGKGGIQVTYRSGSAQGPQVRTGILQAGSGQWGVGMDVNMDVGVDAIDYRGLVRIDS